MTYEFHVHHENRLVYRKIWGGYNSADSEKAHEYWDKLCEEGDIHEYDELIDLTEVTEYGISIDQIQKLTDHYKKRAQQEKELGTFIAKKIAYVIPSPLAYGTGRVYGSLIEETGLNFRVFAELSDACTWLELAPESVDEVLIFIDKSADPV